MLGANANPSREGQAVRAIGLVKRFGPRAVLSDVDLTVENRQVHALLGANGSGKSTLVKILSGYYSRDAGNVVIGGVEVDAEARVADVAKLGVRTVHQDLGLVNGVSVLENVAAGLGFVNGRFGLIDWRATRGRVVRALSLVGLDDLDPDDLVDRLPTWQRVAVACARALYDGLENVRLLILDEITAALPPGEVRLVLDLVRRIKKLGAGILYVTHRFEEVIEITDQITVLRDGKVLVQARTAATTVRQLVEWVSGDASLGEERVPEKREYGPPVLRLDALSTGRLKDISLTLRAGEVCGVIGRAGCGKSALGRAIFGQEKVTSGAITLLGEPYAVRHPKDAIRLGVAYVPQDRQRSGVLPFATVSENFTIAKLDHVARHGFLSAHREREVVSDLIRRHAVVPPDGEAWIQNLSGGNQQKIIVGRWDLTDARLYILDEPTEGVDVAARAGIYRYIRDRAARGAAVLVLSSSLEEIAELCDRAVCLADGRLVDALEGGDLTVRNMEHLLVGELDVAPSDATAL